VAGVAPGADDAAAHAAVAARSAGDRICERVTRRAATPGVHDRAAWKLVDAGADAHRRGGHEAGAVLGADLTACAVADVAVPVLAVTGLVRGANAVRR